MSVRGRRCSVVTSYYPVFSCFLSGENYGTGNYVVSGQSLLPKLVVYTSTNMVDWTFHGFLHNNTSPGWAESGPLWKGFSKGGFRRNTPHHHASGWLPFLLLREMARGTSGYLVVTLGDQQSQDG